LRESSPSFSPTGIAEAVGVSSSNEFAYGAYLMTGTGIVPDSDFTLQAGDTIWISIEGTGTLRNKVEGV